MLPILRPKTWSMKVANAAVLISAVLFLQHLLVNASHDWSINLGS